MISMREKIARAIYHGTPRNKPWELLSAYKREQYVQEADAVLDALMEPTEGMELAGGLKYEAMWFEDDGTFTGIIFTDMGTIFRAMIQAVRDGA